MYGVYLIAIYFPLAPRLGYLFVSRSLDDASNLQEKFSADCGRLLLTPNSLYKLYDPNSFLIASNHKINLKKIIKLQIIYMVRTTPMVNILNNNNNKKITFRV